MAPRISLYVAVLDNQPMIHSACFTSQALPHSVNAAARFIGIAFTFEQ